MRNPFTILIKSQMVQYLQRLTENVHASLGVQAVQGDYWVAYGSVVLNNISTESDIDLLYVSRDESIEPYRVQAYFEERPVTVYIVTSKVILDDGADYKYGGYFTGKLFSPHITIGLDASSEEQVYDFHAAQVGNYLANFIHNVPAKPVDALKAYLDFCPWYEAYLLKFFSAHIDRGVLATALAAHYAACLATVTDMPAQMTVLYDTNEVSLRRIRATSRFWSYGAIEHGNNHMFADFYFDKAEAAIKKIDPTHEEVKSILNIIEQSGKIV